MTSQLLTQLGLGGIDIGIVLLVFLVLLILLLILLIVTMTKQSNLRKRYESFMMGSNARSMEEEIRNLFYDIDYLKKETEDNNKEIRHIYKRLETVFQRVGLVKYDALRQMGGKLSFALALLDEKNNGFLMNSVHSTDGSYCYIKEIRDGSCEIELSADEQKALSQALMQEYTPKPKKTAAPPEKSEPKKAVKSQQHKKQTAKLPKEEEPEDAEYEEDDSYEDPALLEAEAVIARKKQTAKTIRTDSDVGSHVSVRKVSSRKPITEEDDL